MNRFPFKKLFAPAVLASATLLSGLGAGCLDGAITSGGNHDAGAGVYGDGGNMVAGPDMAVDLQAEFEAKVQPLLLSDCGGCHAQAGGSYPGFLAATSTSSVYKTFTNFPGLVGYTPETSRILTKGPHANPQSYTAQGGYTPSAELQAHAIVISDYIKLFNMLGGKSNADADMGTKTRMMPIAPQMGVVNTLNLGQIDPAFTGMTVTFTPSLVGTTQIKLGDVKLKAGTAMGVRVKSPVFGRYAATDPNVTVDIDYSMLGADITAYMGSEITFGTGILIFAFTPGELLGLSFELIEQKAGTSDMGPAVGMCKDLAAYNVFKPRLTTAQTGMNNSCSAGNCHGQSGGVGGFNLNGFAAAANDASICAGVLINSNVTAPDQSPIYKHATDASGHAGGKLDAAIRAAYLAELTTFINAQK